MYVVYAIVSRKKKYVYVGITKDLKNRLNRHNKGYEKTTCRYIPFQLIYTEQAADRKAVRAREKYFKSRSGKRELYQRIAQNFEELTNPLQVVVRTCLAGAAS